MPLIHPLAGLGCIAAALAMFALAREHITRGAHLVMVAAMTALYCTVDARPVVLGSAVGLGVTAAVLLCCRGRERRTCAVDTLACAVLLGILGASGHASASDGMTMPMPQASSGIDARIVVTVLAVAVGWAAASRWVSPRRGGASWGAAAVMLTSMVAMTLA